MYAMEGHSAIKKKKLGAFVVMQMGLESVIQSEVSQKEKNKVFINAYMWNSVVVQAVKNLFATWIGNIRARFDPWRRE